MASSNDIRAGRAFVEIISDDSKLQKGLAKAQARLAAWGSAIRAMGTQLLATGLAALAPIAAAGNIFSSMGAEIARGSEKAGMGAETFSALAYAARQCGVDVDQLGVSLGKMEKFLYTAATGNKESIEALGQLKLKISDLQGFSPEQKFALISERLAGVADEGTKAGVGMAIFGRGFEQIVPLVDKGSDGIDGLISRARALGLVMSSNDAKAGLEFSQRLSELYDTAKMAAFSIGAALAPAVKTLVLQLTSAIKSVSDFVNRNRQLINAVAAAIIPLAAAAIAVGAAMIGVGTGFIFAAKAIAAARSIISIAYFSISTGMSAVTFAVEAFAVVVGFLSTSVGAITAALAVGIGAMLYFSGVGYNLKNYLAGVWVGISDDANKAFKGIKNALYAGDWKLAAQILWATLKLEWTKGIGELQSLWATFKAGFMTAWADVSYKILEVWDVVVNGIQVAWHSIIANLTKAWIGFMSMIKSTWDTTQTWLAKLWIATGVTGLSPADQVKAGQLLDKQSTQTQKDIQSDAAKGLADANSKQDKADKYSSSSALEDINALRAANAIDDDKITAAQKAKLAAIQATIDAIKKERDLLRGQATGEALTTLGGQAWSTITDVFDGLKKKIQFATTPDVGTPGKDRISSQGTFSTAAIFGLGGQAKHAERTAKATEATSTKMDALIQVVGTAFSFI